MQNMNVSICFESECLFMQALNMHIYIYIYVCVPVFLLPIYPYVYTPTCPAPPGSLGGSYCSQLMSGMSHVGLQLSPSSPAQPRPAAWASHIARNSGVARLVLDCRFLYLCIYLHKYLCFNV